MHQHTAAPADIAFRDDFAAGRIAPAAFDHQAHVRLAYTFLVGAEADAAVEAMRDALHAFLARHGIPVQKYHATMTRAWVLAVRHFMTKGPSDSADQFLARNPQLLDSKIMLTHYSAELLFSPAARAGFVAPDLQAIPEQR